MYERLEGWGLPGWIVYPDGGGEQIGKEKKSNAQRPGRDMGELPPAEQAEPLFRKDLERLRWYVAWLKDMRERYQEQPVRWLSYWWHEDYWETYYRSSFSEEAWRRLCEEANVDPAWESIVVDLKPRAVPSPSEGRLGGGSST